MNSTPRLAQRLLITVGIIVLGIVFGLIMQNIWLGLLLALLLWLGWFIGYESRRGGGPGVNDTDHGIEL